MSGSSRISTDLSSGGRNRIQLRNRFDRAHHDISGPCWLAIDSRMRFWLPEHGSNRHQLTAPTNKKHTRLWTDQHARQHLTAALTASQRTRGCGATSRRAGIGPSSTERRIASSTARPADRRTDRRSRCESRCSADCKNIHMYIYSQATCRKIN